MLQFIHNYFGFNRQQRNGLVALMCVSLLLLVVRLALPFLMPPASIDIRSVPTTVPAAPGAVRGGNLFVFDPNTVSEEQLVQLGFSEKRAKTFVRYRDKGGKFRQKADLKKVYGLSPALYEKLEPYILIPRAGGKDNRRSQAAVRPQAANALELNTADSISLVALKGIGPSFAKRIIKYRTLLGGYISKEQLLEVYGFTPEMFAQLKDQVRVDHSLITLLDLNKDDFKTVNRHPYLSYEQTKAIFDWRRKTVITSANLRQVVGDSVTCSKLRPYLRLD